MKFHIASLFLLANLSPQLKDGLIVSVVGSAIGLLGTLVTVAVTLAKDLGASAQRVRTLDEATKRATFWDTWSKALAAVDPEASPAALRSKVKVEVLAAAESVEKAFDVLAAQRASDGQALREHQRSQGSTSWFRRWFLLYKPPRARAWIPRVFFYLYVMDIVYLPFVLPHPPGSTNHADVLGLVLGCVIAAVFFRWLSIRLERPRVAGQRI